MVRIMQENGEVVVLLGSSANYHNIQTFLTADASLSVEPLYPQVAPSLYRQEAPSPSPPLPPGSLPSIAR